MSMHHNIEAAEALIQQLPQLRAETDRTAPEILPQYRVNADYYKASRALDLAHEDIERHIHLAQTHALYDIAHSLMAISSLLEQRP